MEHTKALNALEVRTPPSPSLHRQRKTTPKHQKKLSRTPQQIQILTPSSPQPFLALSKSATSPRAAVDLIERATSAPNTFIFTELLSTPQIQALATAGDAYPHHLTLLQIFSYGTWATYRSTPSLPALNDAQKRKLRQLTLLTLARSAHHSPDPSTPVLSYPSLLSALDLASPQELEELVISAIYAGLLSAKLDPQHALVRINHVAPLRDVAPGDGAVSGLLTSLRSWADRCDATLHSLEAQMNSLREAADRRASDAAAREDRAAALVDAEKKGVLSQPLSASRSSTAAAAAAASEMGGGVTIFATAPNGAVTTSRRNILLTPAATGSSSNTDELDVGGGRRSANFAPAAAANAAAAAAGGGRATRSGGAAAVANASTAASGSAAGTAEGVVKTASKRGSGHLSGDDEGNEDEAGMELDEEEAEEAEGKKRTSRRKLEG